MAVDDSRSDQLNILCIRVHAFVERCEAEADALSNDIMAFLPLYQVVASSTRVDSEHAMRLAVFSSAERADAFSENVTAGLYHTDPASTVKIGVRVMDEVRLSKFPREVDTMTVEEAVGKCLQGLRTHEMFSLITRMADPEWVLSEMRKDMIK